MIGEEDNSVAKEVIDRYEQLKAQKQPRVREFDLVAKLYRPSRVGFDGQSKDHSNLDQLYNSATLQNASQASASHYSTLANPANKWFKVTTPDPELREVREVKEWHDIVTRRMLASFRPAVSNFYSAAVPWLADTSILGTGFMVEDESQGRYRILDRCISPVKAVFGVGPDGMTDELGVPMTFTPVQAAREYGYDNLPKKVQEIIDANGAAMRTTTHTYLQMYQPNDEYTPGYLGRRGQKFLSTHVCIDAKAVVRQKGTYEQSFAVPRWDVDDESDDPWGRGLGFQNLASAIKLQIQEQQNQQAGGLAARPPIGTPGQRAARGMKMAPGKFLHGAVSHTGQQLVKPIFTFNGLPVTLDMAKQTIEEVENGWLSALMTLQGRTGLNNLEVIERQEERLRLSAPYLGRAQTEGIAVILDRRFSLLWRAGQIPPPPAVLQGQPMDIEYTSVAALAQRAQDGVAVSRVLQDTAALAQTHPDPESVWDAVDTDYAQKVLVEARGAPEKVMRSPEDVAARRDARAQQQAAAEAAEAAQQGVDIAGGLAALEGGA
ncbi:portal protein [Roseobacter sp.]|uniref:portal protein n=1 Tax=Roseobacter sp. TaxID=1907202 RepID=UPI00296647D6|nr:portal protein [Roseobacter sp.]MDW3181767.1 portal protein [Roseobacter sp.]